MASLPKWEGEKCVGRSRPSVKFPPKFLQICICWLHTPCILGNSVLYWRWLFEFYFLKKRVQIFMTSMSKWKENTSISNVIVSLKILNTFVGTWKNMRIFKNPEVIREKFLQLWTLYWYPQVPMKQKSLKLQLTYHRLDHSLQNCHCATKISILQSNDSVKSISI